MIVEERALVALYKLTIVLGIRALGGREASQVVLVRRVSASSKEKGTREVMSTDRRSQDTANHPLDLCESHSKVAAQQKLYAGNIELISTEGDILRPIPKREPN